jgi:adenylosuccinate synthase
MNVVVIGAQWGDEGKGKIVDFLADKADAIVRYAGGANAGHTIVIGGEQYALHLVPSGILYPEKRVFLGGGMVIDPEALFSELEMLRARGIDWHGRVFISDRAHIVLPRYRVIDRDVDAKRKRPIGTTGRGIGIAYAMKSERDGIRLADLQWRDKLDDLESEDRDFLNQYTDRLLAMKTDLTREMWDLRDRNVLMEGAQGAMLDLDSGTYPYVSSGLSAAAGAAAGSGIGPRQIHQVLGVFKAYTTRVGNGPLPTEFDEQSQSALYNYVRETGREYGVTTGRPRRCGILDLVALRYACRANSIDSLVLTHLDVYDTLAEIEACVAYDIKGERITDFPASIDDLNRAKPVHKKFAGWKTSLKKCRSFDELPKEARDYVSYIEEYCETPVGIVSVGYDRSETFVRRDAWQTSGRA